MPHFIYCGRYYFHTSESIRRLRNIFLTKMRSYGIRSAILTMMDMYRRRLMTKEKVKKAYRGKLKNDKLWKDFTVSINDDLENFFDKLQNQQKINLEMVRSFFTPKLTDDEMRLVEERNELHLGTYSRHYMGKNPDVDIEEMKRSDSKSKYLQGCCARYTTVLKA